MFKSAQKYGRIITTTATGLVLSVSQAHAAVPAAVNTAISDASSDMVTIASAIFVAIIGLLGFKLMRKAAH